MRIYLAAVPTYFFRFLSLIFLSLALVSCGEKESVQKIDLDKKVDIGRVFHNYDKDLKVCIGSILTPEEGYRYYRELLRIIEKKIGIPVVLVERGTYSEVNALLQTGDIDIAFVCDGPYVDGHDKFGLELLAAPVVKGKKVYQSYIIVPVDSKVQRLEDLKGKSFAFVDPLSNTGRFAPLYMLHQRGLLQGDFFGSVTYTYSHDASIKAVAEGIVDAAAVDSLIWDYLYERGNAYVRRTRIIALSEDYAIPPVVVRPDLDGSLKRKLRDIFLNMHNDKEAAGILKEMRIDRFVDIEDSAYDSVRKLKIYIGRKKDITGVPE